MTKTLISTVTLGLLTFLLMASAQSGSSDDEVAQLRLQLAQQALRVDQLEHAAGKTPGADGSGGSSSAKPVRTMVLVSISKTDHTGDNAQEIARLQRESAALMNSVESEKSQAASDAGQQLYVGHVRGGVRGWGGAVGGGYATSNVGAAGRQVAGDKMLENRYATEHAIKKRKLEKLKRSSAEPRQIIVGHDGNTIFTLETKHDLSRKLDDINIGDTVTWTGNRVNADATSESWKIVSIRAVR